MLKNKTTGKIIVKDVCVYRSVWLKAKGLMFSRRMKDKCLVFEFDKEQKVPLHMLFVFFPIDVIFLDKNKKVVEIKKNFKPFSNYNPKNKSVYVIELPKGKADFVKVDDFIGW